MGCRHFTGASISLPVMFAKANLMFMRRGTDQVRQFRDGLLVFFDDARDGLLMFNLAAQENLLKRNKEIGKWIGGMVRHAVVGLERERVGMTRQCVGLRLDFEISILKHLEENARKEKMYHMKPAELTM
ncbi:hypothetical protein AVEN_182132-1 [Araneus ventricosus]|uniref:Uncharacterized protein n=1 Tax=Araneus ventricosus TaxID=182803 RepID=A0A4Y2GPR3_ARAVE|nr:hypothetical protein AVEN_182132-1 [Araneus ventricosus]